MSARRRRCRPAPRRDRPSCGAAALLGLVERWCERQGEPELGTTAVARIRPHAAAERGDDAVADWQAEPQAAGGALRLGAAVERREQAGGVRVPEAESAIEHVYARLVAHRLEGDLDRAVGAAVLVRVRQQVLQQEDEMRAVGLHDDMMSGYLDEADLALGMQA